MIDNDHKWLDKLGNNISLASMIERFVKMAKNYIFIEFHGNWKFLTLKKTWTYSKKNMFEMSLDFFLAEKRKKRAIFWVRATSIGETEKSGLKLGWIIHDMI